MGGNALKNTATRRYQRDEFLELQNEVVQILLKEYETVRPLRFYAQKPDFGDLDIVIPSWPRWPGFHREHLVKLFNPNEVFCNDNVISIDYKEFQIDVKFVDPMDFPTVCLYHDFNDLGNLMGKLVHCMGITYGHLGLHYSVFYHRTHLLGKVELTRDPAKIFSFFGLNKHVYDHGFQHLEEIFHYVTTSRFFCKEAYEDQYHNHTDRTRNRKRKVYADFLEWLEKCQPVDMTPFIGKDAGLQIADSFFPEAHLIETIGKWCDRAEIHKARKANILQQLKDVGITDAENIRKVFVALRERGFPELDVSLEQILGL